jgi:cytochrome c556
MFALRTLKSRLRPAALVAAAVAWMPIVSAGPTEDAIEYRQAVMGVYSFSAGQMADMAKGKVPFDAAAFQTRAKDLAAAAGLDVLAGFPEDSVSDDSDAKDEIWLNWADFESKLEDLRTQSAKLAEVAAGGDEAAMKAQLDETRGTCKACHDDYKK